jgi:hypothetical protein
MLTRPTLRSGLALTLVACTIASVAPAALLAPPASASESPSSKEQPAPPAGNGLTPEGKRKQDSKQVEKPTGSAPGGSKAGTSENSATTSTNTSGAPSQGAPSGSDVSIALPEEAVVTPESVDLDAATRPGDVIEPSAQAILARAERAAMDVRVLELVTEYQSKTFDGNPPARGGVVPPTKVLLQYNKRDSVSMPRLRVEPVDPAAGGSVVIFDGDGSAVLDLGRKLWYPTRSGFPGEAQAALMSLPRWVVETRSKGLIKERSSGKVRPGGNQLVAARVIGTEVVDGEECDVVVSAIASRVFQDDEATRATGGPMTYTRQFETVAFSRTDGLPRRIHVVSEVPGRGPNGNEERTALYTKVKVNGELPPVAFGLAMPEGFSDGRTAQPAAPATSPAAPATPPAAAPKQ